MVIKLAKHCALVEALEYFFHGRYGVAFSGYWLYLGSTHVHTKPNFIILFWHHHHWTNP